MRPDKQKQKYKKRAGYGPNKETSKEETKGRNKAPKTGDDKDRTQKNDEASASAVAKEDPRPDSGSEDEIPGNQPRPQFRRRTVESNWNRYEEPPDEEVDRQVHDVKVAELQQLLSARIASGAHLILEDERDWSEGGNDVTTLNDDVTGLEYLNIDCDWLVDVTKSIPLHQLLGVEEIARQANLVQYFNTQASDSCTQSKGESSKFCFRSPSKTESEADFTPLSESLAKTLNHPATKTELTSDAKSDEKCSLNDAENRMQPGEEFSWDRDEVVTLDWDNVPEVGPAEEVEQSKIPELPEHDEEKCKTLPEPELSKKRKVPEPKSLEVPENEEEEDELEALLSLSAPATKTKSEPRVRSEKSATTATSVAGATAVSEDLEDWLNTII